MFMRLAFFCVVYFCWAVPSHAQVVTDVAQKIQTALNSLGPVQVNVVVSHQETREVCHASHGGELNCVNHTVTVNVPSTARQVLTVSNIRIVRSTKPVFGSPVRTELPENITADDGLARNCSGTPFQDTFVLRTTFQRTANITLSKTVTHTQAAETNFSLKLSEVFSLGGKLTFTDSETVGTIFVSGNQTTIERTRTRQVTVPPHTTLIDELRVWPVHYAVPFTSQVVVDADLNQQVTRGGRKLSDVLSESQRTFDIAGSIEASDAAEGEVTQFEAPADQSSHCPSSGGRPSERRALLSGSSGDHTSERHASLNGMRLIVRTPPRHKMPLRHRKAKAAK